MATPTLRRRDPFETSGSVNRVFTVSVSSISDRPLCREAWDSMSIHLPLLCIPKAVIRGKLTLFCCRRYNSSSICFRALHYALPRLWHPFSSGETWYMHLAQVVPPSG